MATPVRIGLYGGPGGEPWELRGFRRLIEIRIWHREVIRAISFLYDDYEGNRLHSGKHGTPEEGKPTKTFSLRKGEILSSITGTCVVRHQSQVIESLLITTDRNTYWHMHAPRGMSFSLPTNGGTVVGFHGKAGNYLYAIGLLLENPVMATPVEIRPYGGPDAQLQQLRGIRRLVEIKIWHNEVIRAISFSYYDSSRRLKHRQYGKAHGDPSKTFSLDEDEILSTITGTYRQYGEITVVESLSITTNRRTFQHMSAPRGMAFSLSTDGHTSLGFNLMAGKYLYGIGLLKNLGQVRT